MTRLLESFANLHEGLEPLVLYNIWDAASAAAVERAGAKAVATGSFGVAGAHGYGDGQQVPFDFVVDNAARIVASVSVPVTIDLETGYGDTIQDVAESAKRIFETGVVGVNIEDQLLGGAELRDISEQSLRLKAASDSGLWINARTDIFIKAAPESHDERLVQKALARCQAYADAGAKSFFVPFLTDGKLIEQLCAAAPLPVNIMMKPGCPSHARLKEVGVARISYGPAPWRDAMSYLEEQAKQVYAT